MSILSELEPGTVSGADGDGGAGLPDGNNSRRTAWERLQCYDHMMMKKNANSKVEECLRTRGQSGVFGEEKRLDEHSSQASRAKNS